MNPKAIINGREVEIFGPDDWTTRELCDAEKALGMIFDGSSAGAAMAITFYVSLRRLEPDKPPALLADEVLNMKFSNLREATDDASPPAEDVEPAKLPALDDQQISGNPRSEASA